LTLQEINGREAKQLLFMNLPLFPHVARIRFLPTSSQALGCFALLNRDKRLVFQVVKNDMKSNKISSRSQLI
jgi:hypothetical protein